MGLSRCIKREGKAHVWCISIIIDVSIRRLILERSLTNIYHPTKCQHHINIDIYCIDNFIKINICSCFFFQIWKSINEFILFGIWLPFEWAFMNYKIITEPEMFNSLLLASLSMHPTLSYNVLPIKQFRIWIMISGNFLLLFIT